MKVVKSAEHYTETALDEIKLLKSVSLIKQSNHSCFSLICLLILLMCVSLHLGEKHRSLRPQQREGGAASR